MVEKFAANRHIERVEGILEAEVGVTLVDTTQKTVDAALSGWGRGSKNMSEYACVYSQARTHAHARTRMRMHARTSAHPYPHLQSVFYP